MWKQPPCLVSSTIVGRYTEMTDVLARAAERNMISAQTANQDLTMDSRSLSEGEPLESAGEMIFSIPEAIAFFSCFVTLRAGDLLCMGTLLESARQQQCISRPAIWSRPKRKARQADQPGRIIPIQICHAHVARFKRARIPSLRCRLRARSRIAVAEI